MATRAGRAPPRLACQAQTALGPGLNTIGDPVDVRSNSQAEAGSYGAGLAPFFLGLSAWIGGYVLFRLVRPLSQRALAANQSSLRVALGGWYPPMLIGVLQMVCATAVLTLGLDIEISNVLTTLGLLILTSATFVAIVHALNARLGAPGQFLGLVLLVLQLVTAGGTFPWQTILEPLYWLHHLLPMSYAIDGLRQLMYGGLQTRVLTDVVSWSCGCCWRCWRCWRPAGLVGEAGPSRARALTTGGYLQGMGQRADRRKVRRVRGDVVTDRPDTLAAEEPMEIRVGGQSLAVTMRTPGDDFELAVGFLVSEGFASVNGDVTSVRYCDEGVPDPARNLVEVTLDAHLPQPEPNRSFFTSSSCGLCGKDSLDSVRTQANWALPSDRVTVPSDVLLSLPDRLREGQAIFERTGGLHAAGLFTRTGELLCIREDVGRHNAVDKLVGWAMLNDRLPLRHLILQVSGRTSFELVQKAWMAGIPILSAVSAPSTLAVDLAEEAGMTLAGFVRGDSMNLYAGAQRVVVPSGD